MRRATAARGDSFPELKRVAQLAPNGSEIVLRLAGYLHAYEGFTSEQQELSHPLRVLVVLCALCAKGEHRLTPNYVRRLYRMEVTDATMLDAAFAMAPVLGYLVVANLALAIETACSPSYPFGAMPADGPPAAQRMLAEFELRTLGADCPPAIFESKEFNSVVELDPHLFERVSAFAAYCAGATRRELDVVGQGVREMMVVVALCMQSRVPEAKVHIRRARAYGLSRRRLVEAVACLTPTVGALILTTLQQAMTDERY